MRVQIALGYPAGPGSFRHALRGVRTVVHLALPHALPPTCSAQVAGDDSAHPGSAGR